MEVILAWRQKFINLFLLIYKFTKQVIFGIKVKLLAKVLCLSVLFYGGIEVTKEYFSYPYVYRLSVKPNERLDLPPITICTERDVLFDKTRINQYFNVTHDMSKIYAKRMTNNSYNDCIDLLTKRYNTPPIKLCTW